MKENEKKNRRLVIVDLDGTLINANTGMISAHYYLKNNFISYKTIAYFILSYIKYKQSTVKLEEVHQNALTLIDTLNKDIINVRINRIFTEKLMHRFNSTIIQRIKNHIKNNDYLVLMTSSNMILCKIITKYIPFDRIIATELQEAGNYYLPKYKNAIAYHHQKLIFATSIAQELQLDLKNSICYADSHSDLPLMLSAGKAVAVNPNKKLKKEANKRDWEIIDDKTSVKLTEQLFEPQRKNAHLEE